MTQYCTSCGTELSADSSYCGECGTAVEGSSTETEPESVTESSEEHPDSWRQYTPNSWRVGVAGAVFGLVIGGLVAWALANIGGSGVGFLIAFLGGTIYLWQKPTATGATGSGLYISALLLILVPLLFYGGMLADIGEDPETAEEAGMAIGGVLGLVIWGFVFTLIAVVVGAVGYFFKRREKKKLGS